MHVRQLGWLHAVPEGKKKSRLQAYKAESEESDSLKLPPIDGAEYLVQLLYEAGLVMHSGMGIAPLSWAEISKWLDTTELYLTVWEKLTIKTLSEAYASEYNQASDPARPAPYTYVVEDLEELDRVAIGSKMKALFRSLKKT